MFNEFDNDYEIDNNPTPLTQNLTDVEKLDVSVLPRQLAARIADICERAGAEQTLAFTPLMISVAAVTGSKIGVYPKANDPDFFVPLHLWGLLNAASGEMKSPVLKQTTEPLRKLDKKLRTESEEKIHLHMEKMERVQAMLDKAKKGGKSEELETLQVQLRELKKQMPPLLQLIVNDITIEKLGIVLHDNKSVVSMHDEIMVLFKKMTKLGNEGMRETLLSLADGDFEINTQRISRESVAVEGGVSLLGGVQPDKLLKFIKSSEDDGLNQRIQLLFMPPRVPTKYRPVDRPANVAAEQAMEDIINKMYYWEALQDPHCLKYRNHNGKIGLSFCLAAQRVFDEWDETLINRIRFDIFNPSIKSHLSKYPALVAKVSAIFHIIEFIETGELPPKISELNLLRAIYVASVLEKHITYLYEGVSNNTHAALVILEKVKKGSFKNGMTVAKMLKCDWAGVDKDELEDALALLENLGWMRSTEKTGNHCPSTPYHVEPHVKLLLKNRKNYIVYKSASEEQNPWLERLKGHMLTLAVQVANAVVTKPTAPSVDEIDIAQVAIPAAPDINITNWFENITPETIRRAELEEELQNGIEM